MSTFQVVPKFIIQSNISNTAKILYISMFNLVRINYQNLLTEERQDYESKVGKLSKESYSKIGLTRYNFQKSFDELLEQELLTPYEDGTYSINFINKENELLKFDYLKHSYNDKEFNKHSFYINISDDVFYTDKLTTTQKIYYMAIKGSLYKYDKPSFSSTVIKSWLPGIPATTARSAFQKLEELGFISLQLVNPNIGQLGYKSIKFFEYETHIQRAKSIVISHKRTVKNHKAIVEMVVARPCVNAETEINELLEKIRNSIVEENIYENRN